MAYLRTLRILKEIYLVFEKTDFELRTNKKLRKQNKDKLQICSNLNGTLTVVAPRGKGRAVYMTFDGTGVVEIWGGGVYVETFRIEENKHTPEEIRNQFRKKLTDEYGVEFKNGDHQVIGSDEKYILLPTAKMITQFFQVFHMEDLNLKMWYRSPNTGSTVMQNRFKGGITSDGKIVIQAQIEMLIEGMSPTESISIVFDGSDSVAIINKYRTDSSLVAISEARHVLIEEYGVSFKKEWEKPSLSIFL